MANLAWTAALQNRVAYTLFGNAYSSLTTQQKTMMDGGTLVNPPVEGFARDGFHTVQQAAQWYELLGATVSTDAGESWMVYLIASTMAMSVRPEAFDRLQTKAKEFEKEYRGSISAIEITTGYDATVYTLTPQSVRYHVLNSSMIRSEKFAFSPETIDATLFWVMNYVWNKANWNFRRILCKIVVATANNGQSPTFTYPDDSSFASTTRFDSLATRNLCYVDGTNDTAVRWANADQMAALKSDSTASTGKPQWLRIERSANTLNFIWHPYPDAAYTLSAEILTMIPGTATPGVPTSATDTVPYATLPTEMIPVIKSLVLGKILKDQGVTETVWAQADDELQRFVPIYDDHGEMDSENGTRDVYGDVSSMAGSGSQPWYGWGNSGDLGGGM